MANKNSTERAMHLRILKWEENFKRSDIKNKIYKKPVSASQLQRIVSKI